MVTFVDSIEHPKSYVYCGVTLLYVVEKDHLLVKGSMFAYNWDSSFRKAVKSLEKSLGLNR